MTRYMSGSKYAVAGANYASIQLPIGGRLRFASARNFTTPGQRVDIILCSSSMNLIPGTVSSGDVVPIAGRDQGGINDPICWSGDSGPLDQSMSQVVAIYWNCAASDRVLFTVGVE